jgi:hypothetical protein
MNAFFSTRGPHRPPRETKRQTDESISKKERPKRNSTHFVEKRTRRILWKNGPDAFCGKTDPAHFVEKRTLQSVALIFYGLLEDNTHARLYILASSISFILY